MFASGVLPYVQYLLREIMRRKMPLLFISRMQLHLPNVADTQLQHLFSGFDVALSWALCHTSVKDLNTVIQSPSLPTTPSVPIIPA